MTALIQLQRLVREHSREGSTKTKLLNVTLFRSSVTTDPIQTVYEPSLCMVVQGAKLATLGRSSFNYGCAQFLVVPVNLPLAGAVSAASEDEPYLGFKMNLDLDVLRSLILELPEAPSNIAREATGLMVGQLTPPLSDALVRLLQLLSSPADMPILAPMIEREILYRLMTGEHANLLRQLAAADSRLSQINRAIDWIRQHYSETFRIEALAETAGMSVSSFHQHFKAVTSMSPLQYQKHIRLHEARRLVLSKQMDAAIAGFHVGYESPSQFSREYKRVFGAPPLRDAARFRQISDVEHPAA